MKILKKLIVWGCVAGALYFLLSNHVIFVGSRVRLLKKSSLSMDYTFFSTQGKTNQAILSVDTLRHAGIGRLLVETGKISGEELDRLTATIE
jgi:hypothetical protein